MQRLKRSLHVRLNESGRALVARTIDVSAGGMLISARSVLAPGTRATGVLVLDDGTEMPFEVEVRWARKVHSNLAVAGFNHLNRMGLRFVSTPSEPYYQLLLGMWNRRAAA
jgi:hypothetical protein